MTFLYSRKNFILINHTISLLVQFLIALSVIYLLIKVPPRKLIANSPFCNKDKIMTPRQHIKSKAEARLNKGRNSVKVHQGRPQMKKSQKFQLLAEIFQTPSPLFKKGPTDENVGISYLIVIIKFGFFRNFQPPLPYFTRKPNLTDFYN